MTTPHHGPQMMQPQAYVQPQPPVQMQPPLAAQVQTQPVRLAQSAESEVGDIQGSLNDLRAQLLDIARRRRSA
jgi:hypothetical protein